MAYIDKMMGCLYGGAVGDALGYPVEFLEKEEILSAYGRAGIQDYALSGGKALMSDDTQMTLFTLSGLLAWRRSWKESENIDSWKESWKEYVWKSYQDWLFTQDKEACSVPPRVSWLAEEPLMQVQRAPGATCLSALKEGIRGSIGKLVNDSKGCGGLMRVAPAAFWENWDYSCDSSYLAGAEMASMTHGHPLGIICAAAFVRMLDELLDGRGLRYALDGGMSCAEIEFRDWGELREFKEIMDKAVSLSQSTLTDQEAIEAIGQGWVAEEALAIAVYCCLKHEDDFAAAVTAAVNHGGDSDSTGAVAGNIMGAFCGYSRIPRNYLEHLEAKEILDRLALELAGEKGRETVWERVRRGRWITGYSTKRAIRLGDAFVVEGLDRHLRFEEHFTLEYLLLYQWKKGGATCKVRVGPRRFLKVSDVEEGTLEVALYAKRKGEEPDYRLETPLVEKRDGLLRFDAEKFLKDCGFDCRSVEKEEYDRYAFEFRHYTNSRNNELSRAYASGGGLFYWTYAWLDQSEDSLEFLCVNPQSNEEGKKYYGGSRTWAGEPFDKELQMEAEMEVLERIEPENAAWLEAGK